MTLSKSVPSLALGLLLVIGAAPAATPPIRLHPDNPHYFEFRGQPTVLVTSGEHYGAVMNLDFDYVPYLNRLQAEGLNLTRTFSGQYCEPWGAPWNTLNPPANRYVTPWARSSTPGYADGGNKFDLHAWDAAYFSRLKDFVGQAGARGIVVELVLFCVMYDDNQWNLSPMKSTNNVNGIGEIAWNQPYDLSDGAITGVEDALVQKIVTELNGYDNVYYELCNEPYFGAATQSWHQHMADQIVATEAGLPNKHLFAHNIANGSGRATLIPAVSILNYHYANPPDAVAQNYDYNRVIAFDETGFRGSGDSAYRTEAWEFILAGGAVYSNLDWSYTVDAENGTSTAWDHNLGGGGPSIQHQLGILKTFIHGFDFVHMGPDNGVVTGGIPGGASIRALVQPGKQVAIYLKGGSQATLQVSLPSGSYKADWVDPKSGAVGGTSTFSHAGGNRTLSSPGYSEDIALKILRTGNAATTPKILPLGDSLTYGAHSAQDGGIGGYRNRLWTRLTNDGLNVDFVGSVNGPALAGVDPNHEGHGGWRIDDLTGQIDGWLASSQPDIILLLAGANDIIQGYDVNTAESRMNTLLDHLFADLPNVTVLLSTLPWVPQPNFYNYDLGKIQDFNSRLPGIVTTRAGQGRSIQLVGMYSQSGLVAGDYGSDGVHPIDAGYDKMADVWYGALAPLLTSTPPPPPPPTGSGTFYRAINLNGPALTIDGHAWEGSNAPNYSFTGSSFANQGIALSPATDADRATMIRSSIWNSAGSNVTMSAVPSGTYQVFLYVWEDNFSTTYSVMLEGQTVQSNYSSGSGGHWDRLGPWNVHITDGSIDVACTAGDANLSGLEVWQVSLDAPPGGGGAGPVLREYWTGIGGTAVADLTQQPGFPGSPSGTSWEANLEAPTDWADNYGTRLRAYLMAPADGAYTFWISGDDNCELYLSTDEWPANKVRIAWVPGWTSSREWTKYAEQQSAPIVLAAGHSYYIEALQKEGNGGDNLAVGWSIPGGGVEQPIPGARLSAVDPALGADAGAASGGPSAVASSGGAGSSSGGAGGAWGHCGATGLEGLPLFALLLLRRRQRLVARTASTTEPVSRA